MSFGERVRDWCDGKRRQWAALAPHRTTAFYFIVYVCLAHGLVFKTVLFFPRIYFSTTVVEAVALGYLVAWVGYPFALWFDAAYVRERSDWSPRRWVYIPLGMVLGPFGYIFILHYLITRRRWLLAAEGW